MKKLLKRLVPDSMKPALRSVSYRAIDVIEQLKGERDSLTPPRSLIFIGAGDFKAVGEEFRRYALELGDLKPHERMLDVGSGIGRMAVPVTNYLKPPGEYHGFDIVKMGVDWCQRRVASRFPNFHFKHLDVYNKEYNPNGKTEAKNVRFPYEDGYFDFVLLTSVFTHMMPLDLENYLSEISRVTKKGGRSLITYFLLNEDSLEHLRSGRSTQDFRHEHEGCLVVNKNMPEAAIAFHEDAIRKMYEARGLSISEPIRYGSWCGRQSYLSYQDIVVARKEG